MQEDNVAAISGIGPDLFSPPHILHLLMELFAGDKRQGISQQEHMVRHLITCHYCRTAVMVLLGVVQEYDHRNNDPEEPARDLLVKFANISREIEASEAREYERLGAYAEAIVFKGRDHAKQSFPDVADHLSICNDCDSIVEKTVSFIKESEED
jgi:hypothetical protein